jgi:hypothetical protein
MNRPLITSAAAALLLGGSMISAPAVLTHHRLTPYHSHIRRIVSPTPDSLILNASFENTSPITSGQRSGTGALQVTAGSAEYQDVSARVQPGHTYQLTGYMKVLNSEAAPMPASASRAGIRAAISRSKPSASWPPIRPAISRSRRPSRSRPA